MALGVDRGNPLNIKFVATNKWQGQGVPSAGMCTFEDPVMGLRAGAVLLISKQDRHGLSTIRRLIEDPKHGHAPHTAGADENPNAESYSTFVAKAAGVAPDAEINLHLFKYLRPVLEAMVRFENGKQPYTPAQLDKACALAGVQPEPQPLVKTSRTVQGAAVAAVATALPPLLESIGGQADTFKMLAEYLPVMKYAFVFATLCGIGAVVWARIHDRMTLAR